MDKNRTEKERLFQWACEHATKDRTENIFTLINKDSDSYFEKVENKEYLKEYEPDTAVDIKQELSSLWENDKNNDGAYEQVTLICAAACMKNKHLIVYDETTQQENSKKQLKPYIYQF